MISQNGSLELFSEKAVLNNPACYSFMGIVSLQDIKVKNRFHIMGDTSDSRLSIGA